MLYNFISKTSVLPHHSASLVLLHLYDPHQTGVVAVTWWVQHTLILEGCSKDNIWYEKQLPEEESELQKFLFVECFPVTWPCS